MRRSSSVRKPSASNRPTSPVRMKRLPAGVAPFGLARLLRQIVIADHHRRRNGRRPRRSRRAGTSRPSSSISRMSWPSAGASDRMQLVRETGARRGCRCRRPRSCRNIRPGRPASARGCRASARRRTARWCENFMRKLERSNASKSGSAIRRLYCTGTSIAWVARSASARRRNPRASNFLHQHDGAAARERGEDADQRRIGIERRRDERDGVLVIAEQRGAPDVQPAHAVRLVDALGRAGRARGIDRC